MRCGAFHWNILDLLGAKPLKKNKKPDSPPKSYGYVHSSSARGVALSPLPVFMLGFCLA